MIHFIDVIQYFILFIKGQEEDWKSSMDLDVPTKKISFMAPYLNCQTPSVRITQTSVWQERESEPYWVSDRILPEMPNILTRMLAPMPIGTGTCFLSKFCAGNGTMEMVNTSDLHHQTPKIHILICTTVVLITWMIRKYFVFLIRISTTQAT